MANVVNEPTILGKEIIDNRRQSSIYIGHKLMGLPNSDE